MSEVLFDVNRTLNVRRNRKRIVWLETFFYAIPCNILDYNPNLKFSSTVDEAKPIFVDVVFQFQFQRISELQFRVTFKRTPVDHSTLAGEYEFQFQCDTNIFDGDPKTVQMQVNQFIASMDFWLNASYRQDFLSDDLKKQLEFKISVQMIEYDYSYPSDIGHQLEELRKTNNAFFSELGLMELGYILQIQTLTDIFAGRQNAVAAMKKRFYVSRAAIFSKEIFSYLRSKNGFSTAPVPNVDLLLNNLLNDGKVKLDDTYILRVYYEACYLGLNFLKELSRDCLLCRLSEHDTGSLTDYEYLLFDLLKAAVHVNDEYLFEKCAKKLYNTDNKDFSSGRFLKKLEMTIFSRFVLYSLERRMKNIELHNPIGIGADETSRFFELL